MKLIIWGCGDFGRRILPNVMMSDKYEVVAYTDNNERLWGQRLSAIPIIAPRQVADRAFDMLLIVVSSPSAAEQIKAQAVQLGVPQDKVVNAFVDLRFMDLFIDQRICFISGYADWIRSEKIEGNVAECGVFRGDSAKFINYYFSDRKLYLCDTFEGFDRSDMQYEKAGSGGVWEEPLCGPGFFCGNGGRPRDGKNDLPAECRGKEGIFPGKHAGRGGQVLLREP